MMDYPRVRASNVCPLCIRRKDQGLIACWYCYHLYGLGYGNKKEAEGLIEKTETNLCKSGGQSNSKFNL